MLSSCLTAHTKNAVIPVVAQGSYVYSPRASLYLWSSTSRVRKPLSIAMLLQNADYKFHVHAWTVRIPNKRPENTPSLLTSWEAPAVSLLWSQYTLQPQRTNIVSSKSWRERSGYKLCVCVALYVCQFWQAVCVRVCYLGDECAVLLQKGEFAWAAR